MVLIFTKYSGCTSSTSQYIPLFTIPVIGVVSVFILYHEVPMNINFTFITNRRDNFTNIHLKSENCKKNENCKTNESYKKNESYRKNKNCRGKKTKLKKK